MYYFTFPLERDFAAIFACKPSLTHPIGNRALWYVRTLLVFLIFGGVSELCARIFRYKQLVFSFVFIGLVVVVRRMGFAIGPGSGPLYFLAGMLLSSSLLGKESCLTHRNRLFLGVVCCGGAIIFRGIWVAISRPETIQEMTWLANVSTILLLGGLWFTVGEVSESIYAIGTIRACCSVTAFVYFLHYPCNDIVKNYLSKMNREILYVMLVIFMPVVYLLIALFVKKVACGLYKVLSGGR